jgi:hypothetical protein
MSSNFVAKDHSVISKPFYLPKHFIKHEKDFMMDLLYGFGIRTDIFKSLNIKDIDTMKGGGTNNVKFIDVGGVHTYKVEELLEEDRTRISVLTEKNEDCVTIFIDKGSNIAILNNLSYYNNCAMEGLRQPGTGNKLLRFALNLILELQPKYGIKRILLKDNSFLQCTGCPETIKLAQLRILTHGKPWYSSYGFKPYDAHSRKPSKDLYKSIEYSNNIFNKLKISDIDIEKVVKKSSSIKKIKLNVNDIMILIKKYILIRDLITRLLKEFDKYCCIINHILIEIYKPETKTGLTNFHGKVFYLNI